MEFSEIQPLCPCVFIAESQESCGHDLYTPVGWVALIGHDYATGVASKTVTYSATVI